MKKLLISITLLFIFGIFPTHVQAQLVPRLIHIPVVRADDDNENKKDNDNKDKKTPTPTPSAPVTEPTSTVVPPIGGSQPTPTPTVTRTQPTPTPIKSEPTPTTIVPPAVVITAVPDDDDRDREKEREEKRNEERKNRNNESVKAAQATPTPGIIALQNDSANNQPPTITEEKDPVKNIAKTTMQKVFDPPLAFFTQPKLYANAYRDTTLPAKTSSLLLGIAGLFLALGFYFLFPPLPFFSLFKRERQSTLSFPNISNVIYKG